MALVTFAEKHSAIRAIEMYQNTDDMRVYPVKALDMEGPDMSDGNILSTTSTTLSSTLPIRSSKRIEAPPPMSKCTSILKDVMDFEADHLRECYMSDETWFSVPVDIEELGIPDYFEVIEHPMDLGSVKEKLNTSKYNSPDEFANDVRLVFSNAMTYNHRDHAVYKAAKEISNVFEKKFAAMNTTHPFFSSKGNTKDKNDSCSNSKKGTPIHSSLTSASKVVDLESSKKAWGMLLQQPKKEEKDKAKRKKLQQTQQEIIELDAEDVFTGERRDQEISARFKENLLKRKSEMAFATKSENDDGPGKSVNPFFQRKEQSEKKAKSSSSYVDLTMSSNLITAITFPDSQHVGLDINTCREVRRTEYKHSYSKCVDMRNLLDKEDASISMDSYDNFGCEDEIFADDLSLAVTCDLEHRRCFKADQPMKLYANLFQAPTSLSSSTLRALGSEFTSHCNVEQSRCDEESVISKSMEIISQSPSCPTFADVSQSLTTWLNTWAGTRSTKGTSKKKRSSKWDQLIDDDYDSDMDDYPNVLAIIGPNGSGKTNAVHLCANEMGMNVIEIGCGQLRSGAAVKKLIIEATQSHGLSGDKGVNLILFDEVDIIFEEDVGFYNAIQQIAKSSRSPIVLTSEEDVTFLGNIPLRKIFSCRPTISETMQLLSASIEDEDVTEESRGWKVTNDAALCTPVTMFCGNDIRSTKLTLKHPLVASASTSNVKNMSDFLLSKNLDICVFDSIEDIIRKKSTMFCERRNVKSLTDNDIVKVSDNQRQQRNQSADTTKFAGIPVPTVTDVYPRWIDCNFYDENIEGSWIRVLGENFESNDTMSPKIFGDALFDSAAILSVCLSVFSLLCFMKAFVK